MHTEPQPPTAAAAPAPIVLTPMGDQVLIRRKPQEQKTESGITVVTTQTPDVPSLGFVIAAGAGARIKQCECGAGIFKPLVVQVGDLVLYGRFAGHEVTIDTETLVLVREEEILAVLSPPAEESGDDATTGLHAEVEDGDDDATTGVHVELEHLSSDDFAAKLAAATKAAAASGSTEPGAVRSALGDGIGHAMGDGVGNGVPYAPVSDSIPANDPPAPAPEPAWRGDDPVSPGPPLSMGAIRAAAAAFSPSPEAQSELKAMLASDVEELSRIPFAPQEPPAGAPPADSTEYPDAE
jgi:chaperonin GroES